MTFRWPTCDGNVAALGRLPGCRACARCCTNRRCGQKDHLNDRYWGRRCSGALAHPLRKSHAHRSYARTSSSGFCRATQPQQNLYGRDLVSVARFVKVLTDLGTPTAAVEVAVTELRSRPDAAFKMALRGAGDGGRWPFDAGLTKRPRMRTVIGVTTAARHCWSAVSWRSRCRGVRPSRPLPNRQSQAGRNPFPAEVIASSARDAPVAKPTQAFAAAKPDPCAVSGNEPVPDTTAKQQAWTKTDHRVAAARWSPKQRTVTMSVIPVMRQEAAELRRLADESMDPLRGGLLRAQSRYVDNYAAKLAEVRAGRSCELDRSHCYGRGGESRLLDTAVSMSCRYLVGHQGWVPRQESVGLQRNPGAEEPETPAVSVSGGHRGDPLRHSSRMADGRDALVDSATVPLVGLGPAVVAVLARRAGTVAPRAGIGTCGSDAEAEHAETHRSLPPSPLRQRIS